MKRSDLKTGVVYRYGTSQYDAPTALVIVDLGDWREVSPPWHTRFHTATEEEKAAVKHLSRYERHDAKQFGTKGMLAVTYKEHPRYRQEEVVEEFDVDRLLKVTLEQVLTSRLGQETTLTRFGFPPQVTTRILENGRGIQAEWWAHKEAEEIAKQARLEYARQQAEKSAQRVASAQARRAALQALGGPLATVPDAAERKEYDGTYEQKLTRNLTLTWEQVDALLSLLPLDAEWVDPNVSADGWSYEHPEGVKP